MTIFNDTNVKRVEKIREIVTLLGKSVESNKASHADVWKLLQPAIDDIGALVGAQGQQADQDATGGPESVAEPVSTSAPKEEEPAWYTLHRLAQDLPLKDLNRLVAIYVNRVDDELK